MRPERTPETKPVTTLARLYDGETQSVGLSECGPTEEGRLGPNGLDATLILNLPWVSKPFSGFSFRELDLLLDLDSARAENDA